LNYSDFSFWWILLLFGIPFFTVRFFANRLNLWRGVFDTVGIISLSLILFYNASASSFIVFIFEIIVNYLLVQYMLKKEGTSGKLIAAAIIVFDVAILAYFKYLTFFVEDVIGLFISLPENWQNTFPIPIRRSIPPGVSFYTFQMVGFVVDSLNARKKKPISFLDYVNFIVFFPQVVAGPIERRIDLLPQITNFRFKFSVENFEEGLRWISLGLFMKFVLADNISPFIKMDETSNPWMIWFFSFLFTLKIYFDFGGYSFVAVGIGKILGIKLTVNFLAPYTSQSINEFWRRWHVTLSTWFRDYVFIPLMGSQKQLAPMFLFITFTLSGFWHGAAWNFIIWGAYHGALLLVLRYLGRPFQKFIGKFFKKSEFISWGLTFGSVVLGCLFFMETNTGRLFTKLKTILTPWSYSFTNLGDWLSSYSINEGWTLMITLVLSTVVLWLEFMAVWQNKFEYEFLLSPWISRTLLGLTILLAASEPSEFIYFAF
jgi:D-alanyl-lipoteichoic acid acyltransferase DltB (MBOAT superfamily)